MKMNRRGRISIKRCLQNGQWAAFGPQVIVFQPLCQSVDRGTFRGSRLTSLLWEKYKIYTILYNPLDRCLSQLINEEKQENLSVDIDSRKRNNLIQVSLDAKFDKRETKSSTSRYGTQVFWGGPSLSAGPERVSKRLELGFRDQCSSASFLFHWFYIFIKIPSFL